MEMNADQWQARRNARLEQERDKAIAERDEARAQSKKAVTEAEEWERLYDAMKVERDEAVEELEYFKREAARFFNERDEAREERDAMLCRIAAVEQRPQGRMTFGETELEYIRHARKSTEERDEARAERDDWRSEYARVCEERDGLTLSRQRWVDAANDLGAEYDIVAHERDGAEQELADASMAWNAKVQELTAERDEALAQSEKAVTEAREWEQYYAERVEQVKKLATERDEARAECEKWERAHAQDTGTDLQLIRQLKAERDEARNERDEVQIERNGACQEVELVVAERDEARAAVETWKHRCRLLYRENKRLRFELQAREVFIDD